MSLVAYSMHTLHFNKAKIFVQLRYLDKCVTELTLMKLNIFNLIVAFYKHRRTGLLACFD